MLYYVYVIWVLLHYINVIHITSLQFILHYVISMQYPDVMSKQFVLQYIIAIYIILHNVRTIHYIV